MTHAGPLHHEVHTLVLEAAVVRAELRARVDVLDGAHVAGEERKDLLLCPGVSLQHTGREVAEWLRRSLCRFNT